MQNFQPLPFSQRLMIGPDPVLNELLAKSGLAEHAEYRGTDLQTGNEYWQIVGGCPVAFIAVKRTRQIVVWSIGEDPDNK